MPRPPDVLCYIKLPDKLADGRYDQYGHRVDPGVRPRLVLSTLPPPSASPIQCWGVFDRELEPGQYGFMIFTNVPGQAVPGAAFTEWDEEKSTPTFAEDRLMVLYSAQRALGAARIIGRNASDRRVAAAAGLLFVAPQAAKARATPPAPAPKAARTPASRPAPPAPTPRATRAARVPRPAPTPTSRPARPARRPSAAPAAAPRPSPASATPQPGPAAEAPRPGAAPAAPQPGVEPATPPPSPAPAAPETGHGPAAAAAPEKSRGRAVAAKPGKAGAGARAARRRGRPGPRRTK